MEHDPAVLEFWDKPPSITLHYSAKLKNGGTRNIGVLNTPTTLSFVRMLSGGKSGRLKKSCFSLLTKSSIATFAVRMGSSAAHPSKRLQPR